MNPFTKKFKFLSKNDALIAGGKGASLGEMLNAGIPVPDGFVVTADTFDFFIKETDLIQEIESILATVNTEIIHTVENASEKIQALIADADIPKKIRTDILEAFDQLETELVAVRSSATAEDGVDHAWAGQLESYMNIERGGVVHHVQECWASLFTPRAIFYRFEKGLHASHISVAVVIQKMVNSEKSGVAFSVHPVTEDHNQIIIEAGFGFGDAIVSGSITPDAYVVTKSPRKIIDINVNYQNRKLRRRRGGEKVDPEWGENTWEELSAEDGEKQVLAGDEIQNLADLIIKIENHYGGPMDIEWAMENGKFYITQSRPITTLRSLSKKTPGIRLEKLMTREQSLINCQIWSEAESLKIDKWTGSLIKNHIFRREEYGLFTHWYDPKELDEYYKKMTKVVQSDSVYVENISRQHLLSAKQLRESTFPENIKKSDVLEFINLFRSYFETLPAIFDMEELDVSPSIKKSILSVRKETEDLSAYFDSELEKIIPSLYPNLRKSWMDMSLEDLTETDGEPEIYSYWGITDNKITKTEPDGFIFQTEQPENINGRIYGQTASGGKVTGKAKIINRYSDCEKLEDGDVMVVISTNPKYVPYMRMSAAIVADEGGMVSHTAIVARELGKPCIVGTKYGTKSIQDGDLVEVDADNGVITILEKAD